jgi:predicted signal transduction protein with EAL and GGDEF domain
MARSRRGVPHLLEAQMRPLVIAIPRFIQLQLVLSEAFLAVTVYRVRALTSVGVPLMVQVALSILKPAGSVGASTAL